MLLLILAACGDDPKPQATRAEVRRTTTTVSDLELYTDEACTAADAAIRAHRTAGPQEAIDANLRHLVTVAAWSDNRAPEVYEVTKAVRPTDVATAEPVGLWCQEQGFAITSLDLPLPTTTQPAPPPPPPNPPSMSLAEFEAIQTGMSYDDVVAIVGGPGQLLSQTEIAGYRGEIYMWDGAGSLGANANVQLQNGAVIGKAQFGLA